jgi:phospholipid/cholesterol/gamma-HCH transport system substrate-binding protein
VARRSTGPTTFGSGLRLGVFAVITTLALAMLTDALGGISLPGGAGYTAMFTDATGLLPGDEIRIAGAKVGEVDDIALEQGRPPVAKVTFSLDDDREVPSSVHATIRYRNMVGQRYIALTQAPEDGKVSKQTLEPGDVIGVRQTTPALDLTVLLNGFKPLFAALSPDEVNNLSFEIIQTLQGEGSTVESLLAHTASLTSTLADHDETIGSVIDNLNEVLETVADRDEQLDTSITRLQDFVSGLSDDSDALGEAVVSIGTLTTQTSQLVADARPSLDADISALDTLATTLNDNSDTIATTLDRLPDTYSQLVTTASYGSWFDFFLCDFDAHIGLSDDLTVNPAAVHSPMTRCQATGGEE